MANAAVNEVIYWKMEYDKAVAAGKPKSSLTWISQQAQNAYSQLDSATANQLKGMSASQAQSYYANGGGGSSSSGTGSGGRGPIETTSPNSPNDNYYNNDYGSPNYTGVSDNNLSGPNGLDNPDAFTMEKAQQMFKEWQDAQANTQNNAMTDAMNKYMEQQAESARQQNTQMQGQYTDLLNQAETGQANELQALDNTYTSAKGELEDKTFQDYLGARQTMANRGLAGSGLANDQDTRLLMANNKNLANINNNITSQKSAVTQRYGSNMDSIRNQLAALKAAYKD